MPRVFRQQYTAPIPERAESITLNRRGLKVPGVRFRGSDGKSVLAPLTRDGTRCRLTSEQWYANVPDLTVPGGRRRVKLTTNKAAAEIMLADLVRRAAQKGAGMVDPFEQHRGRPLAEHLTEWEAELCTRPRGKRKRPPSSEHVRRTIARVRRVLYGCGFILAGDIALTPVQEFLQRMTVERYLVDPDPDLESFTRNEIASLLKVGPQTVRSLIKRHRLAATGQGRARRYPRSTALALLELSRRGMGACTAGYYAREVKAFTRWLAKRKRLPEDLLADLPGASGDDSDHRRDRRALTAKELRRLLTAARQSEIPFRGMTGPDRSHLYLVAMGTGFRANELAALCPEHFELGDDLPCVRLSAAAAKNGKAAVQPISTDVAQALSDFLADRPQGCVVWSGTWHERAADMFRIDLEAAGIPYVVDGPEGRLYADFHALRHSYVALLDRAGVTLKEAMHLARHADPKLTMKRYGKPQLHDLAAAMHRLPRLTLDDESTEPNALTATGTDAFAYTQLTQTPDRGCDSVSADEMERASNRAPASLQKSFVSMAVESGCSDLRATERSGTSRIRTCNQGIMSPLLCR
jgi:excisionase family DNA binding protein